MLLGLRSLWESGVIPPPPPPAPAPVISVTGFGQSTLFSGGHPRKRKPKKTPWPGDEIEEEDLEELMAMLGIDL